MSGKRLGLRIISTSYCNDTPMRLMYSFVLSICALILGWFGIITTLTRILISKIPITINERLVVFGRLFNLNVP